MVRRPRLRALASSLSAYLRTYAVVNLVSVEQLSFMEFTRWLPSPTCLVSLGMKPYEGSAVLEINTGLLFPILEMLLGGNSKSPLDGLKFGTYPGRSTGAP